MKGWVELDVGGTPCRDRALKLWLHILEVLHSRSGDISKRAETDARMIFGRSQLS